MNRIPWEKLGTFLKAEKHCYPAFQSSQIMS